MGNKLDEYRRLADQLDRSRISRRSFMTRAAALGVSPLLVEATFRLAGLAMPGAEPGVAHAQETGKLVVASWGGEFGEAQRAAQFTPFTKETGIEIVLSSQSPEIALLEAQVTSGKVEWDLANNSLVGAATVAGKGLVQPIDYARMDPAIVAGVDPLVRTEYSVGIYYWSMNLGFAKSDFPDGGPQPATWSDLWDVEKFPGPRGLTSMDFEPPPLEIPLLAAGVAPKDLYPLDIDKAFEILTGFRDKVTKWTGYGADGMQLMMQGELSLSTAGNGSLTNALKEGQPIGMSWEQALLYYDAWVIPKGAPNVDAAYKFIEFCMRPAVQAEFVKLYPVGAVTPAANDLLPEDIRKIALSNPEHMAKMVPADASWWGAKDAAGQTNLQKVYDRWAKWIL